MPRSVTSKPTSLRRTPSSFCFCERLAPDEVALVELADPAEVGFEERVLFVDLVAVERHRGFEPQRVARGESAGQDAFGRAVAARRRACPPTSCSALSAGGVDLEAVLARVAGARDDRGHAVNRALAEVVILDLFERRLGQRLQDAQGFGALQGELAEVGAAVRRVRPPRRRWCDLIQSQSLSVVEALTTSSRCSGPKR